MPLPSRSMMPHALAFVGDTPAKIRAVPIEYYQTEWQAFFRRHHHSPQHEECATLVDSSNVDASKMRPQGNAPRQRTVKIPDMERSFVKGESGVLDGRKRCRVWVMPHGFRSMDHG
jgi:hypothetical protein